MNHVALPRSLYGWRGPVTPTQIGFLWLCDTADHLGRRALDELHGSTVYELRAHVDYQLAANLCHDLAKRVRSQR